MKTTGALLFALHACAGRAVAVDDAGGAAEAEASDATNVDASAAQGVAEACEALGDAVCAKLAQCSPFGLELGYGDEATCRARAPKGCAVGYASSSLTPSRASACAVSLGTLECSIFVTGDLGDGCNALPGTLENNTPCIDNAQCKTTFCAKPLVDHCGVCAGPTKEGDVCVNQACSRGTVCAAATKKCVKPVAGKIGAPCTGQEGCDLANGVGCNPTSGKCIALAIAKTGKTCGTDSLIVPTKFTLCEAAGSCSAIFNGTCGSSVTEGTACGTGTNGPYCLGPSKCIATKCALPDPAVCK